MNIFDGDVLPDYATFCLECHQNAIGSITAKNWETEPHGKKRAGYSGLGINYSTAWGKYDCPNGYNMCGRANGWNYGSVSDPDLAWPVIPKGRGYVALVKGGYDQAKRNAGLNYTLSCTDCHEAHGSVNYSMMRKSLNAKDGTEFILNNSKGSWHGMWQGGNPEGLCWSCHGGYQQTKEHFQWHNQTGYCSACNAQHHPDHIGMGAFNCLGICHSTNYTKANPGSYVDATFHANRKALSASNAYDAADYSNDLVVDYDFENNLKDNHMWNMHGRWTVGGGSFVAGKVGNCIQVNDDAVEVGAEWAPWDSCNWGTGFAYKPTEMKYHTTIEAWIYPTSDPASGSDRYIATKHDPWSGGYSLKLMRNNGAYRVGFQANMAHGGPTPEWDWDYAQGVSNGIRGAYSSVEIPLNQWTHVAATFNYQGDNGHATDRTVGKIRIYVNGDDVTTSNLIGEHPAWIQPQDPNTNITLADGSVYHDFAWMTAKGEMPIYYSDRCSNCCVAFSVGGIMWSVPDGNFIGKIDQFKLWNITKPPEYFGGAIPPAISTVYGQSGYDSLLVTFTEDVYSNTDETGKLIPTDFTLTDSDNGRTIDSVVHTAGSSTATLILSSALDATDDLGVDTLAAETNSIYDSIGSVPVGTDSVTITALSGPSITKVEGVDGNNLLWVAFSEGVYTNAGQLGGLVASDFTLTDTDNSRTITNVSHIAGDTGATLILSSNLDSSNDIDVDTLAAAPSEIFNSGSNRMGTEAVTVVGLIPSTITSITGSTGSDQLTVTFSENVYSSNDHTGVLLVADFNDTGLTISSVDHIAGSVKAYLTLSTALTGSEYGSGSYTIAAVTNEIFNYVGVAMATTAYQITEDTTAFISSAEGVVGSDTIKVTFVEAAYANSNQTGDLQTSDLVITDSDNSRTITGVTHTAGDTIAYLTLSSALDGTSDIDTDTVAAAGGAIFKADGSVMGTTPATITAQAAPTIVTAKGQTGYNKLEVTFSEGVWTGTGQAGVLVTGDFAITDTDNSRTITGVTHTAGEAVATLTLSSALDATTDIDTDTIAAVSSEIFNNLDNTVSTSAVTLTLMSVPALDRAEGFEDDTVLYVTFTEGVSAASDSAVSINSLAANFTIGGAVRITGVSSISHTGGSRFATFTMNNTMDAADVDNATLTAPAALIFNQAGYPVGIESIYLRAETYPQLVEVSGKVGQNLIVARFDTGVYSNTGGDENDSLQVGDFTLVDGGSTVSTISSVDHTPGTESWMYNQDFAFITLSAPLEAGDIGVTTLAPTTIYNEIGNPVPTTAVVVDDSLLLTTMTYATGSVGSDKLQVYFKHIVSSSPGLQDALVPADFVLTDTNSDNARTITAVDHRPGNGTATLTMSSPLISSDLDNDTIGAVSASVFNAYDYPVDTTPVSIVSRYGGPKIIEVLGSNNQQGVVVKFDQGVYANSDGTGSLEPADFAYYEVRQSTKANTILSVEHNPGDDSAALHFEFNRCNKSSYCVNPNDGLGDFYADQIGAASNQVFSKYGDPADITPMTMILGLRGGHLYAAEGVVGSSKILIKFNEGVWSGKDAAGPIIPGDLCYESNNSRTVSSITHTAGNNYAVLNMSAPTIETDFDADAFNPIKNQIWNGHDYSMIWGNTACPNTSGWRAILVEVPAPIITGARARAGSTQVVVTFSEGVSGQLGNLQASDFDFTDVNVNSNSIQSVTHSAGDAVAYLTMNQNIVAGDLDIDTIAATANLKGSLIDNPLNTTPVALRAAAPAIMAAEGSVGYTRIAVTFSVPVYASNNRTGDLAIADFDLVDVSGNDDNPINAVRHNAGDTLAVLTLDNDLETGDMDFINPDTLAAVSSSIYDALGEAVDTTTLFLTSYNGPFITRFEGTAGQDKVQVNFSEGVYSAPGKVDALDTADFVLTDNDDNRTITAVEHYAGTAAAILTLSSALDRDSDVGMDTIAAANNEIYSRTSESMSTVPVTMIGNECPTGGLLINFDDPAGTTVTDSTGLVVGEVTTGDPAFVFLGDGYFTGDPVQQVPTYIDFKQNNRCFQTPRSYTVETRVYFETVDLDYGDAYPLNGLDDDWDYGDLDGGTNPMHSILPEYDPLTPDGRKQTQISLFYRSYLAQSFGANRANYLGYGTEENRDTTRFGFRHWIQDMLICDGSRPNDPRIRTSYISEEMGGGNAYTYLSGHWYTLRVVFNTDKNGNTFDFFGRDEGTDGMGAGAIWSGYINMSGKSNDFEGTHDCNYAENPGSELTETGGYFNIGGYDTVAGDGATPWIPGKMDWFSYKPIADYGGLNDVPFDGNTAPVAVAGDDQNVTQHNRVYLDGSASTDSDGDELTYVWTITTMPSGANPQMHAEEATMSFTASKDGIYIIELKVNDGIVDSAADSVTVTASP